MSLLRVAAVGLLAVACSSDPLPLQVDLDGAWSVTFELLDGTSREGTADLLWDDEGSVLEGEITMHDPDKERSYALLEGEDIETLGVALRLIETTGVRQLFVELMPPQGGETSGGWRTRWGCTTAFDSLCGEDGSLFLSQ